MKTIILSIAFTLATLTGLMAQDKFDIAVVGYRFDTPNSQIYISINGERSEQYDITREQLDGKMWGVSMNPLLKAVNKMQNDGWEIVGGMQASGLPGISMFFYSLRKKR
jgi:hypothetical protein